MASPYAFDIDQRVRIKIADGGNFRPPSENAKGKLGTIVPQLTADWSGTLLEHEAGTPRTYYVIVDGGTTELISEEWLVGAGPNE